MKKTTIICDGCQEEITDEVGKPETHYMIQVEEVSGHHQEYLYICENCFDQPWWVEQKDWSSVMPLKVNF